MIDPTIWSDDGFAELTPVQQVLYIGLFSNADDEGRLKGTARAIRLMLPAVYGGCDLETIEADLAAVLRSMTQLRRYVVGGKAYLVFRNYNTWQRIEKQAPSLLPGPDEADELTPDPFDDDSPTSRRPVVDQSSTVRGTIVDQSANDRRPVVDQSSTVRGTIVDQSANDRRPVVDQSSTVRGTIVDQSANDRRPVVPNRKEEKRRERKGIEAGARATAAPATAAMSDTEVEATAEEREVVGIIRAVPGLGAVPEPAVIAHLREVLACRDGPAIGYAQMRVEAIKFRDYWSARRANQGEKRFTGWKNALTNWFTRVSVTPSRASPEVVTRGYQETVAVAPAYWNPPPPLEIRPNGLLAQWYDEHGRPRERWPA